MAKIYYNQIAAQMARSPRVAEAVERRVATIFDRARAIALHDFDEHVVTKEIEGGIDSSNISKTLVGAGNSARTKDGLPNLFSFIGFNNSDTPTEAVRGALERGINYRSRSRAIVGGAGVSVKYTFTAMWPAEEIRLASPMPFEGGLSWVEGVDEGTISGFGEYIYGRFNVGPSSRSGGGTQAPHSVRGGEFTKRAYMTEIYNDFVKNLIP